MSEKGRDNGKEETFTIFLKNVAKEREKWGGTYNRMKDLIPFFPFLFNA